MSTQSHYEINVSKLRRAPGGASTGRYEHLFATAERSAVTRERALELLDSLEARFPAPEYHVSVTHWECVGHIVKEDTL
jgi:hypothetical protein